MSHTDNGAFELPHGVNGFYFRLPRKVLWVELDRVVIEFSRFRIKLFDPILNSSSRNVVAQLIDRCLQATSALNVSFSGLFP